MEFPRAGFVIPPTSIFNAARYSALMNAPNIKMRLGGHEMVRTIYTEEDFKTAANRICPGPDLEWFAVDRDGHVAGFTNAGFAVVPKAIFESFESFNRALDAVAVLPRTGKASWAVSKPPRYDTWNEWAQHGLFAFDWNHTASQQDLSLPYVLMCQPEVPIVASHLPPDVAQYLSRVVFQNISFQDARELLITE